jgi:hypothetical protein
MVQMLMVKIQCCCSRKFEIFQARSMYSKLLRFIVVTRDCTVVVHVLLFVITLIARKSESACRYSSRESGICWAAPCDFEIRNMNYAKGLLQFWALILVPFNLIFLREYIKLVV